LSGINKLLRKDEPAPLIKNQSAKSQLRRPTHSSREPRGSTPILDQRVRERIRASAIVNLLMLHVEGKRKMRATQVRAALGLLAKVLPDLQTIDLTAQLTVRHVVRDEPLSPEEFARQFCEPTGPVLELPAAKPNV